MIVKMITRYPGIVHNALLGFYHDYTCQTTFLTGERSLEAPLMHMNRYELTITVQDHTLEDIDVNLFKTLIKTLKRARQQQHTIIENFDIIEQTGENQ